MASIICGVDISAATLDARIGRDGAYQQFARTVDGIGELARFCQDHRVELVAMEATGGYERLAFGRLWESGIAVAIVNPRSVRRFAEAVGKLEKTDRIDCAMIAWYAAVKQIQPMPPASATQQRLTALVLRLRQLTDLHVMQRNQRHLVTEPDVQDSFTEVLGAIAKQMRALERLIITAIDADPLWAALAASFREVKGVAGRSIARVLADVPEIGTITNKAVAKLNGLAPLARDSGKTLGRRSVRGGRESVRSVLYVIVPGVCRFNDDFKACAERMRAKGKPPKVIRTALSRKLLVQLNAKARDVRAAFAATG